MLQSSTQWKTFGIIYAVTTVRSIDQQFQWVGLYCLVVSAAQFQNSSSHPEFFKCCALPPSNV